MIKQIMIINTQIDEDDEDSGKSIVLVQQR